jgi:hypothetical protein
MRASTTGANLLRRQTVEDPGSLCLVLMERIHTARRKHSDAPLSDESGYKTMETDRAAHRQERNGAMYQTQCSHRGTIKPMRRALSRPWVGHDAGLAFPTSSTVRREAQR